MEAELSKDRIVKIEGNPNSDVIWMSFSGSITVGGMFTKKDLLLIHGMIGSVVK